MSEHDQPTRREFIKSMVGLTGALALGTAAIGGEQTMEKTDRPATATQSATDAYPGNEAAPGREQTPGAKPNILFVMCDQLRHDAIAALGNPFVHTPNMDRLARRGVIFSNGYSTCPVCVPARYTIRTGCDPLTTGYPMNLGTPQLAEGQAPGTEERCGPYLARTLVGLGYRTWGVGKFHTNPWNENLGYEAQFYSEEMYGTPEHRRADHYAAWIAREHPAFDYIEALMGERTEMYYEPQMAPTPPEVGVEWWAADRAIEQLRQPDARPYFGFVSFVGPHPPLAPPLPFNRMYDPDRLPNPVRGDAAEDLADPALPWMNYAIWAEDINDPRARNLRARYYGEISYIDHCLGRILDAVEARPDADNTLICFFADHGDHLGDHHAWQKESFFEQACHVPYLVSWPARLPKETRREELVTLTDLFGMATHAAGKPELREGIDVLGVLAGQAAPREAVLGCHGQFGTNWFKVMARDREWKYIFFANGGHEQLFNMTEDPAELRNRVKDAPEVARGLRARAVAWLGAHPNGRSCLAGGDLRVFPFQEHPRARIYQFDQSRGVSGFPQHPADVLKDWKFKA